MLNKISNEIIKMSIKTGQRTFNFALKTTKNNVEKVESLIKEHADFMKKIIVLMEVKFSWFIIMYQNQKSL